MDWSNVFAWRAEAVPLAQIEYSGWLIALSVAIAMFGGVAAMQLIGVARHDGRFGRVLGTSAYVAAVLALGVSVWSMHFIGMLAVDLCQPVEFNATITALSILPSLAASAVGLRIFLRSEVSAAQIVHAGVWLGAGIGVMHYSGMAAMEMSSVIRYDPLWFAASLVVAILLAIAGLAARSLLRERWKLPSGQASLVSGAILGLAVSGMHYTAMQASLFVGGSQAGYVPWSNRHLELALAVAMVTCIVFGLAWGTVALAAYRTTAERLRERERLLSDILLNLPGAVVRVALDAPRRQVLASPTLAELTGRPIDDADAVWRLPEWIVAEDRPTLERAIELAVADGEREQATVRLLHGGGSTRRINVRAQAVDSSGPTPLVDLYLSDVTEEHAILARERQLLATIDQVIGRAVLTPEGVFIEANARLSQTLGFRPGELEGQPHRLTWANAAPGEVDAFWAALRAGEAQHGEFARRARDGSPRHLQGWYQPLRNANGDVHAVLKLVVDATDRVEMVEDLLRTQGELRGALASRSAFFANVSHEIRTPMNAVVGFAELLRDELADRGHRGHAQSILDAARALLRILNDLLDAAKLERGEFSLLDAPFRVDRLVGGLVSQFGAMASAKGLDLRLDLPEALPRCWSGDADRLRQILTNLLGNAIKFTERGHVALRVGRDGDAITFEVEDTGIGIPLDRQQAIFDPFVQADAGTARRYGGTGLGMGIVRQLAEKMGGRVALTSAPGVGTTVRVTLPLPVLAADACQEDGATAPPPPLAVAPLRLLAVDDVAQNREVLQALLARDGHRVVVCADAAELLAYFEADPLAWDAVLLDLHMPGIDGFTAARRLRALASARGLDALPVFALSASVHDDDRREAAAAGMDGFLEKPIDIAALQRALAGLGGTAGVAKLATAVADDARGRRLWGEAWLPRLRAWRDREASSWASADGWTAADWHRLAGAAANFALPVLADAARRAEVASRDGVPVPLARARAAWAAFEAWLADAAAPAAQAVVATWPAPAVERATLDAALGSALRRCRDGEIDEVALAVLQRAEPPRAAALQAALDAFDFDTAIRLLEAWRHSMAREESA